MDHSGCLRSMVHVFVSCGSSGRRPRKSVKLSVLFKSLLLSDIRILKVDVREILDITALRRHLDHIIETCFPLEYSSSRPVQLSW